MRQGETAEQDHCRRGSVTMRGHHDGLVWLRARFGSLRDGCKKSHQKSVFLGESQ